jgi:O-antigen/teichoic acid export membrane protein
MNFFCNQYVKNILWLFLDKCLLLVGGFIVSVIVAKYLGPDDIGKLALGTTLAGIALSLSQWGSSHTVFNATIKNRFRGQNYVLETERFRVSIYLITSLILCIYVFYKNNINDSLLICFVIISGVFSGLDVYQFYFNGMLKSKKNALTSVIAKITSMGIRYIFVLFSVNVYFFVIPILIEGLVLWGVKRKIISAKSRVKILNRKIYEASFIKQGRSLVLIVLATYLYTKVNDVILVALTNYSDLGVYTVAYTIAQAWTFIPLSIGISLLTKVMRESCENKKIIGFSFVILIMLAVSLPVLIFTYYFSDQIIYYTFGKQYSQSSDILPIMCLSTLFSSLVFITNRILTHFKGGTSYLLKKVILSAVLTSVFSYFFISTYGLKGAAMGYFFSEFFNFTIGNYFFRNLYFLRMHMKILFSIRYISEFKQ